MNANDQNKNKTTKSLTVNGRNCTAEQMADLIIDLYAARTERDIEVNKPWEYVDMEVLWEKELKPMYTDLKNKEGIDIEHLSTVFKNLRTILADLLLELIARKPS